MVLVTGVGYMDITYHKGDRMKKLLSLILACGLLLSVAGSAFADGLPRGFERKIATYVKVCNGATDYAQQLVGTSTISTDDRILGFIATADPELSHSSGGLVVGLYDTTAVSLAASTNIIAETEVTLGYGKPTEEVWFPYPLLVDNQLVILMQGAGVVTIVYEDVSVNY